MVPLSRGDGVWHELCFWPVITASNGDGVFEEQRLQNIMKDQSVLDVRNSTVTIISVNSFTG